MKLLMLGILALVTQGCASFGNVTRIEDKQSDRSIACVQPKNKFTQMIGFASVVVDRSDPKVQGCHVGHFTLVQDPNAQEGVMCWESCNKYVKAHGFAILKIDSTPIWAKAEEHKTHIVIPYRPSRNEPKRNL